MQYPLIRWLRHRDPMLLMAAASACLGVGLGSAAFVSWPATFVFMLLISVGLVMFIPIASTVVSRLAPVELRGRYMGAWTLVFMGGYALGPLLGGLALDALGGRVDFLIVAAAGLWGRRSSPPCVGQSRGRRRAAEEEFELVAACELRGERPEQAL